MVSLSGSHGLAADSASKYSRNSRHRLIVYPLQPQPNAMKLKIKDCIQHVVLRRIREAFSLKCAVLSALADCYQAEEDNKQLREVCTKGVEACKKGAKTRERCVSFNMLVSPAWEWPMWWRRRGGGGIQAVDRGLHQGGGGLLEGRNIPEKGIVHPAKCQHPLLGTG